MKNTNRFKINIQKYFSRKAKKNIIPNMNPKLRNTKLPFDI